MKNLLLGVAAMLGGVHASVACTGISLTAADGSYIQARTIEWAYGALKSEYVIIPRGEALQSYTPTGMNGIKFKARYGSYEAYESVDNALTLADLQVVQWMLTQCATIDEVMEAVKRVRIVALEKTSVVHWRIGEPSGRQVVMEIVDGKVGFYENEVGVITNAPGYTWQVTNLENYVNLRPGSAQSYKLGGVTLEPNGGSTAMHGLPGDFTPPSRFVRAAFFRNTAPTRATGLDTVLEAFHLLNNFDVPIAIENPAEHNLPSATQWTSAIDLSSRTIYYKTAYNSTIRSIALDNIDFARVKYASYPLDTVQREPIQVLY